MLLFVKDKLVTTAFRRLLGLDNHNMIVDSLPGIQGKKHLLDLNDRGLDVQAAQEKVYSFFLEIVQTQEPEDVLQEFNNLFINCFS